MMDFVTLGMFIIDEIHFLPPTPPATGIMGGAGTFAAFGARVFRRAAPEHASRRVGWTVHGGSDFPAELGAEIDSWDTACNLVATPQRRTTRGWNKYGKGEDRESICAWLDHILKGFQAFKYLTEKLRIDETHLTDDFLRSRVFHLICTPTRCMSLVSGIMDRRRQLSGTPANGAPDAAIEERPIFVWEPVPDSCSEAELGNALKALTFVDVISPNRQELDQLFGHDVNVDVDVAAAAVSSSSASSEPTGQLPQQEDRARMIGQCESLLAAFGRDHAEESGGAPGAKAAAVVVRCGAEGCYVATTEGRTLSVPAFHASAAKAVVVDPTGAGNAFLGGFGIGLLDSPPPEGLTRFENAAVHGSVAASFAVEQLGLPKLSRVEGGRELWNGDDAEERRRELLARVSKAQQDRAV